MIPLFKPSFRVEECLKEIERCLSVGWSGQGFLTEEFEQEWKIYTKESNAIFVNSASAALHLALASLKTVFNWADTSEIISTPLTFVTTNHSIYWSNLKPVLVDVGRDLCLNPEEIEKAITKNTKAVIFVAVGGNASNLKAIRELCDEYHLQLIIDAAHASGAKLDGKDIGFYGDATCFSFQAVKNLPTADSGMLCLKNLAAHDLAKKLSWCGISTSTFERSQKSAYKWEYQVDEIGFKENGNSVMAALGLVGLKYLDSDNTFRRELFQKYLKAFGSRTNIELISHSNENESSRHLIQIIVNNRDAVIDHLSNNGIGTGVHYRTNTHYPMYSDFAPSTPTSTSLSNKIVTLPNFLEITDSEIEYIVSKVAEAVE